MIGLPSGSPGSKNSKMCFNIIPTNVAGTWERHSAPDHTFRTLPHDRGASPLRSAEDVADNDTTFLTHSEPPKKVRQWRDTTTAQRV